VIGAPLPPISRLWTATPPEEDAPMSERWIEETLYSHWGQRLRVDRVLHEEHTEHQHLVIFENAGLGRVMVLDGAVQITSADEFVYHEMMSHVPLFALGPKAQRVLVIGGGDGGILREVLKHRHIERATLCEIDRTVVDMARRHFPEVSAGAFDDPRSEIIIADGVRFVAETDQRFDAVLVDSTDPHGPGAVLFTESFYAGCRRVLNPGGVLVTQNGVPFMQPEELTRSVGYFRNLFADGVCYLATIPTYVGGPMAFGWASDDTSLRAAPAGTLEQRFAGAGFATRYYTSAVHAAAFALPAYVAALL
jgi:spermidine synthase